MLITWPLFLLVMYPSKTLIRCRKKKTATVKVYVEEISGQHVNEPSQQAYKPNLFCNKTECEETYS